MATMSMANEARTKDVKGMSLASETNSSSDFDTAMHRRHEGHRHRPEIVHVHQRRGGSLGALHGEERRQGLRTHSHLFRQLASVGVDERPATAENIGAVGRGTNVTSVALPTP